MLIFSGHKHMQMNIFLHDLPWFIKTKQNKKTTQTHSKHSKIQNSNSDPNSRPLMGARCCVTQKLLWKRRKALPNFCDKCASGQAAASHHSAITSGMLARPSASPTLVPCLKKLEVLQFGRHFVSQLWEGFLQDVDPPLVSGFVQFFVVGVA